MKLCAPFRSSISVSSLSPPHFCNASQRTVNLDDVFPLPEIPRKSLYFMKDFCSIIRELFANSRNFRALSSLDAFLDQSHLFDSATSVLVIHALSHLKKLNRAKAVVVNLRKRGKLCDSFLYSLTMLCMVKQAKIRDVEIVWAEICGPATHVRIKFSDFVRYICKFGDDSEAMLVCKRVLADDGALTSQDYVALIAALCRKNESLLAMEIVQAMQEKGFEPDEITYIGLFQCLCKNGKVSEADLILRNLIKQTSEIDICIYGSFIYGLCKSGKFREAHKLFHKLIQRSNLQDPISSIRRGRRVIFQLNCRGAVPEIVAYETFFRALCCSGRVENAEKLLKEMMRKRSVLDVCVYKSFVKALFQVGRADDALRFCKALNKKGLASVEEISDSLIIGLVEVGRTDEARRLLDEILDNGSLPDSDVCNCVLAGYLKAKRRQEAMDLFDRMKKGHYGGIKATSYRVMVEGLFDHGDIEQGTVIFREMVGRDFPVNGTLYKAMIRVLCDCGRIEEAHGYLNEMMENGLLISYIEWKQIFYSLCTAGGEDLSLGF
ncbi:pentatricopeptide repeat-containing protein At1g12620-like [Aristolochia californica]|uniref:pentatricopeptide repeat-containing protein At1g12620-like n=1 Tax=Aristolochia californica TaxID=171875 RepID=UPI0035D75ED7